MNLHEYQAKSLLSTFNVPVPIGKVINNIEQAREAAEEVMAISGIDICAVKAQIHAGGRGKGGGVKIAHSLDETVLFASEILGMTLVTHQTGCEGKWVNKVLIEQSIYYPGPDEVKEFYFSILLDRTISKYVLVYSPAGGMDIEEVAEKTPQLIFEEIIDPTIGICDFHARKIAYNLGLNGDAMRLMSECVKNIYRTFIAIDASLIEINPIIKTSDNKIFAADAKIVLDDNALFRHPELEALRDLDEEDAFELEAITHNLNFVKLNGNVGCMVNGAGLAMATMDIIKLSGGMPANFLDVGGKANAQTVEAGFRIILKDPKVKAILINIFGGIVRCDRVAQGVVDAYQSVKEINIPVIVRLQGTNAEEAKDLIDKSGLKVQSAITLKEMAELVSSVIKNS